MPLLTKLNEFLIRLSLGKITIFVATSDRQSAIEGYFRTILAAVLRRLGWDAGFLRQKPIPEVIPCHFVLSAAAHCLFMVIVSQTPAGTLSDPD